LIWIKKDNAEKNLAALKDFGMGSLRLRTIDFEKEDNVIQLGYPPNRIDILTSIDGVEFEQAYKSRGNLLFQISRLTLLI